MREYRIYYVERDGRFSSAENVECADDGEAIHKARQADDAAHLNEWASSPGLQPPKLRP